MSRDPNQELARFRWALNDPSHFRHAMASLKRLEGDALSVALDYLDQTFPKGLCPKRLKSWTSILLNQKRGLELLPLKEILRVVERGEITLGYRNVVGQTYRSTLNERISLPLSKHAFKITPFSEMLGPPRREPIDPHALGAMVNPIRNRRDYSSVARPTFLVEELDES